MNNIVGITFDNNDRIEYYYTNDLNLKKNLTVIVETDIGLRFGKVVTDVHPIDKKNLNKKLDKVIRIASKQDFHNYQKNKKDANQALKKCKSLAKYNIEPISSISGISILFLFISFLLPHK